MCSLRKGEVWSKRRLGGARPRGEGKAEGTVPCTGPGAQEGVYPRIAGPWGWQGRRDALRTPPPSGRSCLGLTSSAERAWAPEARGAASREVAVTFLRGSRQRGLCCSSLATPSVRPAHVNMGNALKGPSHVAGLRASWQDLRGEHAGG